MAQAPTTIAEFKAAHRARGHQPIVGMPFVPGNRTESPVPAWARCLSCGAGVEVAHAE